MLSMWNIMRLLDNLESQRERERERRERTKFNKKSQREKLFPYDTRQYPVWRPPVMNAAAGKGEQTPPPPALSVKN